MTTPTPDIPIESSIYKKVTVDLPGTQTPTTTPTKIGLQGTIIPTDQTQKETGEVFEKTAHKQKADTVPKNQVNASLVVPEAKEKEAGKSDNVAMSFFKELIAAISGLHPKEQMVLSLIQNPPSADKITPDQQNALKSYFSRKNPNMEKGVQLLATRSSEGKKLGYLIDDNIGEAMGRAMGPKARELMRNKVPEDLSPDEKNFINYLCSQTRSGPSVAKELVKLHFTDPEKFKNHFSELDAKAKTNLAEQLSIHLSTAIQEPGSPEKKESLLKLCLDTQSKVVTDLKNLKNNAVYNRNIAALRFYFEASGTRNTKLAKLESVTSEMPRVWQKNIESSYNELDKLENDVIGILKKLPWETKEESENLKTIQTYFSQISMESGLNKLVELAGDDVGKVAEMVQKLNKSKVDKQFAPKLLDKLMQKSKQENHPLALDFMKKLLSIEVDEADENNITTLLRHDNMTTTLATCFHEKCIGDKFQRDVEKLARECSSETEYQTRLEGYKGKADKAQAEIDKANNAKDEAAIIKAEAAKAKVEANKAKLEADAVKARVSFKRDFDKLMKGFVKLTSSGLSKEINLLTKHWREEVEKKYPGKGENQVSQIFTLRYVNPMISNEAVNDPTLSDSKKKNIRLMNKCLLSLASHVTATKETWLEFFINAINDEGSPQLAAFKEIEKNIQGESEAIKAAQEKDRRAAIAEETKRIECDYFFEAEIDDFVSEDYGYRIEIGRPFAKELASRGFYFDEGENTLKHPLFHRKFDLKEIIDDRKTTKDIDAKLKEMDDLIKAREAKNALEAFENKLKKKVTTLEQISGQPVLMKGLRDLAESQKSSENLEGYDFIEDLKNGLETEDPSSDSFKEAINLFNDKFIAADAETPMNISAPVRKNFEATLKKINNDPTLTEAEKQTPPTKEDITLVLNDMANELAKNIEQNQLRQFLVKTRSQ